MTGLSASGGTNPGRRELEALACEVAREAGALLRDRRPAQLDVAATKTSSTDIVTEMDVAAELLIFERLAAARPDDGLLGEEHGLQSGTSGLTWVIDPLDGTVNYLYGIGPYAVSIGVVEGQPEPQEWTTLAGCVYAPRTDETFRASCGGGAFCDDVRLAGPPDVPLDNALIATGFGYVAARRQRQARVLAELLPRLRDIRRLGAASVDLCELARGRVDGYYERGLQPWDHAAGALIASEAGAVVTGPPGRRPADDLVVAGAPRLHRDLMAALLALDAVGD